MVTSVDLPNNFTFHGNFYRSKVYTNIPKGVRGYMCLPTGVTTLPFPAISRSKVIYQYSERYYVVMYVYQGVTTYCYTC